MLGQNRGAGVGGELASKEVNRVGCREARTGFRHRCRCGGPLRWGGSTGEVEVGCPGWREHRRAAISQVQQLWSRKAQSGHITPRPTTAVPGNWPLRFLGLKLFYGSFLFLINTWVHVLFFKSIIYSSLKRETIKAGKKTPVISVAHNKNDSFKCLVFLKNVRELAHLLSCMLRLCS